METRLSLLVIVAAIFVGCADSSGPVALSPDHPANPDAEEAPYTPLRDVFAESRPLAVELGGEDAHEHGDAAEEKAAAPDHDHESDVAPTQDKNVAGENDVVELSAEMQAHVDHLLGAYLSLADMLAKDEHEGAADKVAEIHNAAHALDEIDNDKIQDLTGQITKAAHGKAGDLKTARTTFKAISTPVVELVRIAPPTDEIAPEIREAYCPMVKAPWLQIAEKVANPYYGSEMPRCGKITRTLKARGNDHDPEHEHKD